VFGERGGNSDWKDFIRSGRWGGVVGEGGGKDASTSYEGVQLSIDINASMRTYKWRAKIFHSDTTCSPGGIQDIFHQTVSFHTKA
jgi:hypothetical protein